MNSTPSTLRSRRARRFTTAAAVAVAATTLAACGGTSSKSTTASPVNAAVAIPTSVPSGTTLRVADQLNSLENVLAASGQNTNFPYHVQYSEFLGGPPMLQAFQAGAVDLGFVADTPLIFAQAAHQNVVAVTAWAPRNSSIALVTAPGVKLSGWADLKGKKIAFQQGTVEEAVVLEGLKSVGLSLKDVTPVNLTTTSITPALENGSVSAGILVQPLTAAYLRAKPTATQVLISNNVTDKVDFLITKASTISKPGKAAAIADYITRLQKAYAWVNAHPAQWAEDYYVKQYKLPLAFAEKLISDAGPVSFLTLPGSLTAPQQTLADLYTAAGEIPSHLDVASEFNSSFNHSVETNQ